jgi:uncharacterized protein YukE
MTEGPTIELPPGDPTSVVAASETLGQIGAAFTPVGTAMQGAQASVGGWHGDASAQFADLNATYRAAAADVQHVAISAAIAVRRYATELEDARQRVGRLRDREADALTEIATWHVRLAEAQGRAQAASNRVSSAVSVVSSDPFSMADQAAAQGDLSQARGDMVTATNRIDALEGEVSQLRKQAADECRDVEDAERRAAQQVNGLAGELPGVPPPGTPGAPIIGSAIPVVLDPFARPFGGSSRNDRMWQRGMAYAREQRRRIEEARQRLIDGGEVPPPGPLSDDEANRFIQAWQDKHHTILSAQAALAAMSRLKQGEPFPDPGKHPDEYREPKWSREANDFLDALTAAEMSMGLPGEIPAAATGLPRRARGLVPAVRGAERMGEPLSSADAAAARVWQDELPATKTSQSTRYGPYEVQVTGPNNYEMSDGRGTTVRADGFRPEDGAILDAKHVGDEKSPYLPDSKGIPPRVREAIEASTRDEFLRYQKVIESEGTPARFLEVITNDARAKPYFERLMREEGVRGRVIVIPEE